MRFSLLAAVAAAALAASGASAQTTVTDTSLPDVNGSSPNGQGVATTVRGPTGTVTTVTGPSGGGARVGAGLALDRWQQQNVGANASVGITTERARSGNGSIAFVGLTPNGPDGSGSKADMEYYFSQPMALSDFVSASYDWYRSSASTNNGIQTASLRFLVNNAAGTLPLSTALIFEPYYQGAPGNVTTDTWVTSSLSLSSLLFNNNGLLANPNGGYTNSLSYWITNNPGLLVTGLSSGIGSGWDGRFYGGVDNISYDFGARRDSFNFEVAAVPEPATWAMMILGFGVIGGALRARRRQTVQIAFG